MSRVEVEGGDRRRVGRHETGTSCLCPEAQFTQELSFALVAFPLPVRREFTYRIPPRLRGLVFPGMRVQAPLGRRRGIRGSVVGLQSASSLAPEEIKDLTTIQDPFPLISEDLLDLTRWVADYYLCSWGEALRLALPAGDATSSLLVSLSPREAGDRRWASVSSPAGQKESLILAEIRQGPKRLDMLAKRVTDRVGGLPAARELVFRMAERGMLTLGLQPGKAGSGLTTREEAAELVLSPEEAEKLAHSMRRRAPVQVRLLELLLDQGGRITSHQATNLAPRGREALRSLARKGVVSLTPIPRETRTGQGASWEESRFSAWARDPLSPEQLSAVQTIKEATHEGGYSTILVHGVTGSGKTHVYFHAISDVLAQGKGSIFLVPEIALTPQTLGRMRAAFGTQVAMLHSRMTPGERWNEWYRVRTGDARVVLGARSAVFAPVSDLGLIVVDEEHDPSYKQAETPRYSARDVAVMRAKRSGAVAVLGSATPSLESLHNAERDKYRLVRLSSRIDRRPLPQVELVDLRRAPPGERIISPVLRAAMEQRLNAGEQVILFLNRRGFSPFVQCRDCGTIEECDSCNVSLTFHRHDKKLKCHYCGDEHPASDRCRECGGTDLDYKGTGTQKVEEEIARRFPEASVRRLDVDALRGGDDCDSILHDFSRGRVDILLGTQMVTKGHDFPSVTLVGVINADTAIGLPDMRSSERTVQILTQVGGRAGRGTQPGRVVVQTFVPHHPALQAVRHQDFESFRSAEMAQRGELGYPPYTRQVRILITAKVESRARKLGRDMRELLDDHLERNEVPGLKILGPARAPLSRLRGAYRNQIMLFSQKAGTLHEVVTAVILPLSQTLGRGARVVVDVDPLDVL